MSFTESRLRSSLQTSKHPWEAVVKSRHEFYIRFSFTRARVVLKLTEKTKMLGHALDKRIVSVLKCAVCISGLLVNPLVRLFTTIENIQTQFSSYSKLNDFYSKILRV